MDLVTPGFGLVVWTAITFLILLFILKKFAWKPILGAVDSREESIKKALATAEEARLEMKNLKASNEKLQQEAREERDAMLKEAREIKEKIISDAAADAEKKAGKIIINAQETIKSEKQAAIAEIKAQVANLSVEIAEKVVQKELSNKDEQMKLIDGMIDDVKLN